MEPAATGLLLFFEAGRVGSTSSLLTARDRTRDRPKDDNGIFF